MTKTYQEVLEAIQKANESLNKSWKRRICGHLVCNCEERGKFELVEEWSDDVHLEHVLKSLGLRYAVDGEGVVVEISGCNELSSAARYNLSLPFSQQDESLYTFLHKILCQR